MSDLRHALRRLSRSPQFAITGALTLAVGVGGVGGIFALVDSVLLRPLPYPAADRLVAVTHSATQLGVTEAGHSYGTYHYYRVNSRLLEDFAVFQENVVELSGTAEPERVRIAVVTPSFFTTLGVMPALGRSFGQGDGLPGAPEQVILGYDLWVRHFGSDAAIVGKTVELDRGAREVVGVMPRGFGFPSPETEVWWVSDFQMVGVQLNQLFLAGVGRLIEGTTLESAERELNAILPGLAEPSQMTAQELAQTGLAVHVQSLHAATLGDLPGVLWFVLAAMVLVLVVAGANVIGLFLVRAEERRLDVTVRHALGAGRSEQLRMFAIEGTVLGAFAGVVAIPLAAGLIGAVKAFGPTDLPRLHEVGFGARYAVLVFAGALLAGATLTVAPVLRRTFRWKGTQSLHVDQRAPIGPGQRLAMQLLIVGQVAVGLALVVSAALLLHSFWRLRSVDLGFDADHVLTMEIALPRREYRRESAEAQFYHDLFDRIRGLPGVVAAGGAVALPLAGSDFSLREPMAIDGVSLAGEPELSVPFVSVTPGYFEALGVPIVSGEAPASWSSPRPTAMVNAAFARRYLSGRDPIGVRVRPVRTWRPVPWHDITGVVANYRNVGLVAEPTPSVYVPVSELVSDRTYWEGNMSLVIRTNVPPLSLANTVRAVVREVDSRLPVARVRTMNDIVALTTAPARFMTLALFLAAMIAVFLAAVGTYGLVAYAVSRRTHELGVRIALGAPPGGVRRLVLSEGVRMATVGVAIGVVAALAGGQLVERFLYEISAADPATFGAGSLLLVGVVLLAVDVAARRAERIDPIEALRE